ncbi:MAG: hypothetical protein ACYSUX_02030 [Planctomycetota bacterium]
MKKCILIIGLLVVAGCSSEVARWENAGTLVSVRPADELTRPPGRLGTAIGKAEMGRTRVETTEGVYIVHGKISVAQTDMPVKVGYGKKDSSGESQDMPSYLSFGGQQYQIAY